jgi:uncharacterized protein YdaU (DUF1376 family)
VSEAPAFQFYPADFDQGTAEMTLDETGLYIRLLGHQWLTGSVPSDPSRIASVAHTTVEVLERLWPVVSRKFETGPDGRLRNARLEAEREKQREWRAKQVTSGRAGAEARWRAHRIHRGKPNGDPNGEPTGRPDGEAYGEKMPFHSSSPHPSASGLRPSNGKAKKRPFLVPPQAAELVERLRARMIDNNPVCKITKRQLDLWGQEAVLLLKDRNPGEVLAVIDWCQADSFWKSNILSFGKLREKFDQLWLKMQGGHDHPHRSSAERRNENNRRVIEEFERQHGVMRDR